MEAVVLFGASSEYTCSSKQCYNAYTCKHKVALRGREMTSSDRTTEAARELSSRGARKGGKARSAVLTADERRAISTKAARARWAKQKGEPVGEVDYSSAPEFLSEPDVGFLPKERVSHFHGELNFGSLSVPCHVLDDGSRVIAQREVVKALTGRENANGEIRRLIGTAALAAHIAVEDVTSKIIKFRLSGPGRQMIAYGYEATLLVEICEAYLKARDDGTLSEAQLKVAQRADIVLRSCAKVGIIALIDEATGYQEVRQRNALQLKLQAFISDEIQDWARLFPEDFWHELARLEHTHYSPRNRPLRWGKYVMAFVYDAVDKDVGNELREINPNPHFGKNHHQWLKTYGRERVRDHINRVIGVMKTCQDMNDFNRIFGYVFKKEPMQMSFFDLVKYAT